MQSVTFGHVGSRSRSYLGFKGQILGQNFVSAPYLLNALMDFTHILHAYVSHLGDVQSLTFGHIGPRSRSYFGFKGQILGQNFMFVPYLLNA